MGVIRGSSFYEVVSSVSWLEAEGLAKSLGGNLVAINDENENRWFQKTISLLRYLHFFKNDVIFPSSE